MPPLRNLNLYATNQQWTEPVLSVMPTRYVDAEFMNMLMVICDILTIMFTCTYIQNYMQIVCIFVLLFLFACSDVIHGNVCLMWHFTFQRRVGGNCSFPILWCVFRCTAVGHLSIVDRQLFLAASCWALRLAFNPTSIFAPRSSFSSLDFWLLVGRFFYCCGRILMSDSEGSSDTTHESILHNLVQHHLNLHREVAGIVPESNYAEFHESFQEGRD